MRATIALGVAAVFSVMGPHSASAGAPTTTETPTTTVAPTTTTLAPVVDVLPPIPMPRLISTARAGTPFPLPDTGPSSAVPSALAATGVLLLGIGMTAAARRKREPN